MKKFLGRLFKIVVVLVLLLVIAAVALVFLLDPNVFKPRLEAMAREQGIELQINGNLGWQLWPALGVELNDIQVAALQAPEDTIARLEQASLRVAVMPLFRREVQVNHILVDGAALNLSVDESGEGNWERLIQASDPTDATSPPPASTADDAPTPPASDESGEAASDEGPALQLAVERITLSNASLRYRDLGTGQDLTLEPMNLEVVGFNLQGQPFDLDLGLTARVEDPEMLGNDPLAVKAALAGRITLADDMSRALLEEGVLRVELSRAGASDDIRLTVNASAESLNDNPAYQAELALEPFSPKTLINVLSLPAPDMASADALDRLAFRATIQGDTEQVRIEPLTLELDQTRIEGRAAVTDLSRMALDVALTGDRINIDDYLPPASETPEETAESSSGDEPLIPLETLRDLDVAFGLDFDAITAMGFLMEDLSVRVLARDGVINLERATLNAYEGRLESQGSLDGSGETAVIEMVAGLNGLQLAPLLADLDMDEKLQLSGAVNADVSADTQGVTMNELMAALVGDVSFSGAEVRLAPLNVEQKFCEMVTLVTRGDASGKTWPPYTELTALSGQATIRDQVIRVESMQAGVERLTLGLEGQVDLGEARYDFTLPMRLGGEQSSDGGCRVNSNYWVDRSLSLLRCSGSLEDPNPIGDCGLDSKGVQSLITEFATFKIKDQYGDRIEAEKARAEQRIEAEKARVQEKLEQEKRELQNKVRDRLLGGSGSSEEGEDGAEAEGQNTSEQNTSEKSAEERLRNLFRR